MDLNRLRVLAGLDTITETPKSVEEFSVEQLKDGIAAARDKQRTMNKDSSLYKDTEAQIKRYESILKSKEIKEDLSQPTTFFVYGRCERKSGKVAAANMYEAVSKFAGTQVAKLSGDPVLSSPSNPVKFIDEADNKCEYVSYQLADESEDISNYTEKLLESEKPHDSDIPKVTFMDKAPANALVMTQVEFNDNDTLNFNKAKMGVDTEQADKIKVPADVFKHIDKRIKELKVSIETYDEKGYDDTSVKSIAIDCLEKLKAHLKAGNREEYKQAQIYYGTLMSPIFDMFPTQLINFLHSNKDVKKEKI